jgi:16S rRNA (guanine966-N2)-methyltransferase
VKKINNTIRIIGGMYRGKKITFPTAEGLRPTSDRIRETLFNWLMHDIRGARCLDLFAGSGALGFEAHSRGASQVVLVERNPTVCQALRQTAAAFQSDQLTVVGQSATEYLQNPPYTAFDIIFVDPPFAHLDLFDCVHALASDHFLKKGGLLYTESPQILTLNPEFWQNLKLKKAGEVIYALYQRI